MRFAFGNCVAVMGKKIAPKLVVVDNGKIIDIVEPNEKISCQKIIDCKGNFLIPGAIDAHVHFRVPGGEHKEDWKTGSRAAIAGGITTVIDMPNNNPSCTTQKLLEEKIGIAKKDGICNAAFHFGASNDNAEELKAVEGAVSFKVFMGSSTGNLLVTDEAKLRKIFEIAAQRDAVVAVHAEDEAVIKEHVESAKAMGWNDAKYHSKIRNNEAEFKAIEKALELQKNIDNKLHFCHVSTKEGIEMIRKARAQGMDVTCEVTPHHLFLDDSFNEKLGNFAKMNPSLKSVEDVAALWKGITDGTVDIIATDHAPHTIEEKQKPYWDAPAGVPGCETMLPLLFNAVSEDIISVQKIVELCCSNPAKIFGLPAKGQIKEGYDADLVLVDSSEKTIVKNGNLKTKCNWSPFNEWELKGTIKRVFIKGTEVKL